MVAHHPDRLGADRGRCGLDDLAQPEVRLRLGLVGQVAGEDQRLRHRVEAAEPGEGELETGLGVDDAVLQRVVGEQVGIAEVRDCMTGSWVLAELHGATVPADLARVLE